MWDTIKNATLEAIQASWEWFVTWMTSGTSWVLDALWGLIPADIQPDWTWAAEWAGMIAFWVPLDALFVTILGIYTFKFSVIVINKLLKAIPTVW